VALLLVLHELSPSLHVSLVAAHLDHGLRRGSAADTAFARGLCRGLGVPLQAGRENVKALARRGKFSLEEAGRLARYSFFRKVAARTGAGFVAVGHHRDDQAETVLMRLLRGASGSGLSGISPKRALYDPLSRRPSGKACPVWLIRPLLSRSRREIEAFLALRRVKARRDPSNDSRAFLRNRIRHELIPLLERKYNPGTRELLARAAQTLGEEDALLEGLAVRALGRVSRRAGKGVTILGPALARLPLAVRRRVLRLAAVRAGCVQNRLTQAHLDALVRLVAARSGETHLPGCVARMVGARLVFRVQHRLP